MTAVTPSSAAPGSSRICMATLSSRSVACERSAASRWSKAPLRATKPIWAEWCSHCRSVLGTCEEPEEVVAPDPMDAGEARPVDDSPPYLE